MASGNGSKSYLVFLANTGGAVNVFVCSFLLAGILCQLEWYFALDWFIIGDCSCLESLGAVNPQRNGSFPCATYISLCSNVGIL